MGLHKGFRYSSENQQTCEICDKTFASKQGYLSHMRRFHGEEATPQDNQPEQRAVNIPPSPSNKGLREQVERARLESELRRYGGGQEASAPDLMQQSGLPPFTEEAATFSNTMGSRASCRR